MAKKQLLSKPYPIRLNLRCERAWKYLQKHEINPSYYLRQGGEKLVIDKAIEFYINEKKEYCPF